MVISGCTGASVVTSLLAIALYVAVAFAGGRYLWPRVAKRRVFSDPARVVMLGRLVFYVVVLCLGAFAITRYVFCYTFAPAFLSLAVVATGLITFFGFLWYGLTQGQAPESNQNQTETSQNQSETSQNQTFDQADLRTAITVSIVSVYLVLLSLTAFFTVTGSETTTEQGPQPAITLSPITQTMLTSFTALVSVVVPFYFAASAYERVSAGTKGNAIGQIAGKQEEKPRQEEGETR